MAGIESRTPQSPSARLVLAGLASLLALNAAAAVDDSPVLQTVDTTYPTPDGVTLTVAAGDDFQQALRRARPGDVIELEAGAVFDGPFVLPRKEPAQAEADRWILIRSAAPPGALPPEGRRVDPTHAEYMATLQATKDPIVSAEPGASHYRFEGIRIRPATTGGSLAARWVYWARAVAAGVERDDTAPAGAPFLYNLVSLGTEAERFEDLPHHIVFDRCYLHGDPVVGARRGIALNSRHTAVINSYLADFKEVGFDSQAILGWNGPGPFKIVNNYLEAAGENLMFGSAVPRIDGLVPADIEIRGNRFAKPLAWKIDHPTYEGTPWTVKNLLELKNAERVLIEGNVLEYNWPHAQNGFAVLFTVRNQHGDVPWATVSDVTFRNNLLRHIGSGINILGLDDNGHPSRKTRRLVMDNNLFLSVGGPWGGGTLFQLLSSTEQVVISRNTAMQTGAIIVTDGKGLHESLRFTGNVVPHNEYGIVGTGAAPGLGTLRRDFPAATVTGNVLIAADATRYPSGNRFPPSLDVVGTLSEVKPEAGRSGVDVERLCRALEAANPSPVADLEFCRSAGRPSARAAAEAMRRAAGVVTKP